MYFEDVSEVQKIAKRSGCSIFVVPENVPIEIKNALILQPEEKSVITIEQVRDVIARLAMKQTQDVFIIVRPADKLNEEAANALLKNLEEPREKIHFALVTDAPSRLLPTILSRAELYILKREVRVDGGIDADKRQMELAKRLIAAKPADLASLAEELTKKKDGARGHVLEVLAVTIEMLYKSYFKTGKDIFIKKIPKFLACYEAIAQNGHIKLHLVADLI